MYLLKIYVSDLSPYVQASVDKLKKYLDENCPQQYVIEIIDIMENPHLASEDNIYVTPTIVKKLPPPVKKMIGSISNIQKIAVALELVDS